MKRLFTSFRERIPNIAITTDIIVGFPGETDEQSENTLKVVERIRSDGAFMFAYSPRPGTPAAAMENHGAPPYQAGAPGAPDRPAEPHHLRD